MDRQQRVLLKDRVLLIEEVHDFACLALDNTFPILPASILTASTMRQPIHDCNKKKSQIATATSRRCIQAINATLILMGLSMNTCQALSLPERSVQMERRVVSYVGDHHAHQFSTPSSLAISKDRTASVSRRRVLTTTSSSFVAAGLLSPISTAHAATPTTPGEAIRRSAANLPGLGPSDLFYPRDWQGSWKVTRNLLVPSNIVLPEYTIRFLPSIEDDKVILDRGFSQAQLETAIVNFKQQQQQQQQQQQSFQTESQSLSPQQESSVVQSYQWVETNPNDLRLVFTNGGGLKDIKVTKRSSSVPGSNSTFVLSTSEFQRVTLQSTATSIPTIGARRVLTQWKQVDANTLQALEVVYDMDASTTNPLDNSSSGGTTPPVLSKSRILLERIIVP